MLENFTPASITQELIEAVADYLVAKAKAQVLREQVDEIQNEIFKSFEFYDSESNEKIESPKWIYCSDDDEGAKQFYKACHEAEVKAGVKPLNMDPDFCPALVAENEITKTEKRICNESAKVLKMGFDGEELFNRLLCAGLGKYNQWIELVAGLTLASAKERLA
jgi:hypothetical protein